MAGSTETGSRAEAPYGGGRTLAVRTVNFADADLYGRIEVVSAVARFVGVRRPRMPFARDVAPLAQAASEGASGRSRGECGPLAPTCGVAAMV